MAAVLAAGMVVGVQGYALAKPGKHVEPAPASDGLFGDEAPPAPFRSWSELMKVQDRLDARAEKIVAARDDSFTGIEVSAPKGMLTVYWKGGAPSAPAAAAIEKARADGVEVVVLDAPYSEAELMAEGEKLVSREEVTAVAPKVDGSGLLVSLTPGSVGVLFGAVPISTDEAKPATASRGDDSSPYWGGARWNGCSTGFAISISGSRRMLSAGHCAANGDTAKDGGGQTMGKVAGDSNPYDRLYINTSSEGRIYDGGVGLGESYKRVSGSARSFVGNYVCTSGAYSGTRCGSQVKAVNQTINVGYLIYKTVRAEKLDHTNAIGNGDSGGPVYATTSDTSRVTAKGTNTAIDLSTAAPCTGVPAGAGRSCAWRFWYVDVVDSLAAYGGQIVTG
jgi:hypothetical protein